MTAVAVLERTVELARIPAPPLDEADRAEVVAGWWRSDGFEPLTDVAGNVSACLREGTGPAIFVAAHLDTVFGRDMVHGAEAREGRLYGIGVGDNTVAVAALSVLDRLLPSRLGRPLWITATTGEEGLGNLFGARHLVSQPPNEIGALIALEGSYLGKVATIGVGSTRWRVTLEGPGGHAWEAAYRPSTIHDLARMVTRFEALVPVARQRARCSINVGHVEGGEAINARSRRAAMDIDIRCVDQRVLGELATEARSAIDAERSPRGRGEIRRVGEPPRRVDSE